MNQLFFIIIRFLDCSYWVVFHKTNKTHMKIKTRCNKISMITCSRSITSTISVLDPHKKHQPFLKYTHPMKLTAYRWQSSFFLMSGLTRMHWWMTQSMFVLWSNTRTKYRIIIDYLIEDRTSLKVICDTKDNPIIFDLSMCSGCQ